MPEEIRQADGTGQHLTVRHEPTDADLRWIGGIIAGAALALILISYVVLLLFRECRDSLAEARSSRFPLATRSSTQLPPQPRLEQLDRLAAVPSINLYGRQKAKLDILYSYGETGQQDFIHIPIARAMAFLANKLPARGESQTVSVLRVTGTWGLLAAPQNPLLGASAAVPGSKRLIEVFFEGRQNGLVDGGEPNSGRMVNTRKLSWLGK